MRNLTTGAFTRVGLLLIDTQWFGSKLSENQGEKDTKFKFPIAAF